jgi:hypothetical protein
VSAAYRLPSAGPACRCIVSDPPLPLLFLLTGQHGGPGSSFAARHEKIENEEEREKAKEERAAATGYGGRQLAREAAIGLERADEKVDLWMAVNEGRGRPSVAVARAWATSLADEGAPRTGIVNARLAAAAAKVARAAAGQR